MKEDFLHYIWKTARFDNSKLISDTGESIQIIKLGEHNKNAGPDFLNAKIKIGDTLWAGNVEIHVKSSEWNAHGHQNDAAYNNVILHVVWENDETIIQAGRNVACIELKEIVDQKLLTNVESLHESVKPVPCANFWNLHKTPPLLHFWMESWLVERLMSKIDRIYIDAEKNKFHWEQLLYKLVATSLGSTVNAQPMAQLMDNIPFHIFTKHQHEVFVLEAILLGQAGFLADVASENEHLHLLQKEYDFYKIKYNLNPIDRVSWKFFRLRPHAFPTVRLAHLAQLIANNGNLMAKVIDNGNNLKSLELLLTCELGDFWKENLTLDHPRTKKLNKVSLGKSTIHNIIINAIVPVLFAYGKHTGNETLQQYSFELLEQIPCEDNQLITDWKSLGVDFKSAYESQSMIQLRTNYCNRQHCMQCPIGNYWLNKE